MKKSLVLYIAIVSTLSLLLGCKNDIEASDLPQPLANQESVINIEAISGFNIQLPTNDKRNLYNQNDVENYNVLLKKDENLIESKTGNPGDTIKFIIHESGTYTILVYAYDITNNLIAEGQTDQSIILGDGIIKVSINLIQKKSETGFDIEINWTDETNILPSLFQTNDNYISISNSNNSYTLKNTNTTGVSGEANLIIKSLTPGTLYFDFATDTSNFNSSRIAIRANSEGNDTNRYNPNFSLSSSESNHRLFFFIDEVTANYDFNIAFVIPSNSELKINKITIDYGYESTTSTNNFAIWAKNDILGKKGSLHGVITSSNSVQYDYLLSSSLASNYQGWEVSPRYYWLPESEGAYTISFDTIEKILLVIDEDYGSHTKFIEKTLPSGSFTDTVIITSSGINKAHTIQFTIPKEYFTDTPRHNIISNFSITKRP